MKKQSPHGTGEKTMGRLIDACKVIEKINCAIELLGIASKTAAENEGFQTTIKAYRDVRDAIMQEPTAEPEIIRCSECKRNPKRSWLGCPMSGLSERQRPETAWCWKGERIEDG